MTDVRLEATDALRLALHQRDRLGRSLVELEHALAAPVEGRRAAWFDRVQLAMIAVRNAFSSHVSVTEGADGLFDEVVTQAPRLAHRIDVLRREHAELTEEIQCAVGSVDGDPALVRSDLLTLFTRLSRHRQRGADLLYEAYDVDLGFAD